MSTSRAFTVNLDSDEMQSRPCFNKSFKVKILLNGNDDDIDDDIIPVTASASTFYHISFCLCGHKKCNE